MSRLHGTAFERPGDTAALGGLTQTPQSVPGVAAFVRFASKLDAKVQVVQVVSATTLQSAATATVTDFAAVISSKLPLFIGVIFDLGFVLLLVALRSLLVPATAALMNLLAAAASFGVLVALFQWGWGSEALGLGRAGTIEAFVPRDHARRAGPALHGLPGVSRQPWAREWAHTRDHRHSIIIGHATPGRVITAAAAIMMGVFVAFVFGGQRIIAEFGMGLAGPAPSFSRARGEVAEERPSGRERLVGAPLDLGGALSHVHDSRVLIQILQVDLDVDGSATNARHRRLHGHCKLARGDRVEAGAQATRQLEDLETGLGRGQRHVGRAPSGGGNGGVACHALLRGVLGQAVGLGDLEVGVGVGIDGGEEPSPYGLRGGTGGPQFLLRSLDALRSHRQPTHHADECGGHGAGVGGNASAPGSRQRLSDLARVVAERKVDQSPSGTVRRWLGRPLERSCGDLIDIRFD
jgi:hypothetical protein